MIRKGETKNTFFIFIHYVAENKLQIVRHSQKGSRSTDLLTLSLHFTARLHMILHSLKAIAVSWQTACTLSWHDTGCDSGLPIVGRKWHGQKIDLLVYLSLAASVCLLNGKRSTRLQMWRATPTTRGKGQWCLGVEQLPFLGVCMTDGKQGHFPASTVQP